MNLKEHWRAVCRGTAALFLAAGLFFGYWWFYKLAPARHTLSPEWRLSHSEQQYWREVQKGIHRGMWIHDDGLAVGRYGDRFWAEWIMAHVTRGEDMSCFGRLCHSATAMCYITNQDMGEDANAWLDWWMKNKSKSQEEWIADGFRQTGVEIDLPPSTDQIPALLELLGNSNTNESGEIPSHVKYNAFRCLRESDFDPIQYAISNRPFPEDVELGLLEFGRLQRCSATPGEVSVFSFGRTDDEYNSDATVAMLTPKFQFIAYCLVFAPLFLGAGLLLWSFKKGTRGGRSTAGALSN